MCLFKQTLTVFFLPRSLELYYMLEIMKCLFKLFGKNRRRKKCLISLEMHGRGARSSWFSLILYPIRSWVQGNPMPVDQN